MAGCSAFAARLTAREPQPRRGLVPMEWAVVAYAALTTLLMLCFWHRLGNPWAMLSLRLWALAAMFGGWAIYRCHPCRLLMLVRLTLQMALLSVWYPDTYDLNIIFPNLDHLFAAAEAWVFGCQPSLEFCLLCPQKWFSELLSLGYVSYYPLMVLVTLCYFLFHYGDYQRCCFVIMCSFFLFYLVFIFLPVAGPQYYFHALGQLHLPPGDYPALGHYFASHTASLPIPGSDDGLFHQLVTGAHEAGERPTAAFPSSHVGITVVLFLLARRIGSVPLMVTVGSLGFLMFFATFYIQAHYALDAIAGIPSGIAIYWLSQRLYSLKPTAARPHAHTS